VIDADSARGTLLGLACGDALGRPVEFNSEKTIADRHGTVTEMLGDGSHRQPPGTITDDTEMALCIARSLAERGGFDPGDVADRFLDWYYTGPFDIGMMTADALRRLDGGESWEDAGRVVWEHRSEGQNAGNGSVMRCAPLAVAYAADPDSLVAASKQSSAITHYDPRCQYGCAVLNLTIAGVARGAETPLRDALETVGEDAPEDLVTALVAVTTGEVPGTLRTSGYVVHALQTALHDALNAEGVEEAIVTAVNRGGDADTIGAIAGAVAGARFGVSGLPDRWLAAIDEAEEIERLATDLRALEPKPVD
jgi:ADP-ribosyl-[dinitrogen reductase] hydrolase